MAAFGAPVFFGPRHHASRDAAILVRHDAARAVSDRDAMIATLDNWLGNSAERTTAGARAKATVRDGLGAAERSLAVVESLLGIA